MKNPLFLLLSIIITLAGCSGNNELKEEPMDVQGMMELDLSQYGLNVTLMVPDSSIGTLEVMAQSYGDIEVRVGTFFQIKIAPGGDIALKKSDLESDLLFKTTILSETPELLIYKSDLPDGSKSYHHFYMIKKVLGANYEIRDIEESGESFSEAIVKKMVEAANSIKDKPKAS